MSPIELLPANLTDDGQRLTSKWFRQVACLNALSQVNLGINGTVLSNNSTESIEVRSGLFEQMVAFASKFASRQ